MPRYTYSCSKCRRDFDACVMVAERDRPQTCPACGGMAQRDVLKSLPVTRSGENRGWPIVSEAAAVSPDQIDAARRLDRAEGVKTDYTVDGRPVLRSRSHRKRYLAVHGLHDLNGGYGD